MDLDKVTPSEKRAYTRWAFAYERLWRGLIDPVSFRAVRSQEGWTLDGEIHPLPRNSPYRNLTEYVGEKPILSGTGPVVPDTVFLLAAALNPALTGESFEAARQARRRFGVDLSAVFREGFGKRVTLGLLDDRILFDFDLGESLARALRSGEGVGAAPLFAALNLPAYAALQVKDRGKVEAFLDRLREGVAKEGAKPAGGRWSLQLGAYRLKGRKGFSCRALTARLFSFEFRLFLAFHGDDLVLATRPDVLKKVLSGGKTKPPGEPYLVEAVLYPGRWKKLASDMNLAYEEAARSACLKALVEAYPFHGLGTDLAERVMGFRLRCPDGGTWRFGPGGEPACSLHGTIFHPLQPPVPPPANPTARLLARVKEASFSLRFEKGGLRVRMEIRR